MSAAGGLHADAQAVLAAWQAPSAEQEALRRAYLEHLDAHPDGVWRGCVPAHLTASLLVLDADATRVLLTLHRKGGFWGQLGGHCEAGDVTLAGAALREGAEESGIAGLRLLGDGPVDLDRHALSGAFGSCGEHLDVRYAAVAPPGAEPSVSEESDDVAWFGLDALPPGAVDDLARLVAAAGALVAQSSGSSPSPSAVSESGRSAVAETPSR